MIWIIWLITWLMFALQLIVIYILEEKIEKILDKTEEESTLTNGEFVITPEWMVSLRTYLTTASLFLFIEILLLAIFMLISVKQILGG